MMMTDATPDTTAALLLDAWRSGELLEALPEQARPASLAQAYDAQDALIQLAGGRRAGWKLGVGSPAAMRKANLTRALVGQLTTERCHASGVQLSLPTATPITLECEIGFVLDRDIAPEAGRSVQPGDIRAICVTLEVVRSRFVNRTTVGWPSFAADNVGFEALVIGEPLGRGLDLALLQAINESAVVYLDGEAKARSLSGDAATDPLQSLSTLYAHAAERGITLAAGEIVSTGAMCAPFDVLPGGHQITARFLDTELEVRL